MSYLKVLGTGGSKTKTLGTISFQIHEDILVDAGNVMSVLGRSVIKINHIFITHSHCDHISDLPFIIESYFEKRKKPLTIYGSKETIQSLQSHIFNNEIWPDFSKINLMNKNKQSLIFKVIEENETLLIGDYAITSFKANHVKGSFGFVVMKENSNAYMISGDTYINDNMWNIIDNNPKIKSLIVECSFPTRLEKLAFDSKHLTPKLLNDGIKKLKRSDINIFICHIKHSYYKEIKKEIKKYNILSTGGKILSDGDIIHINSDLDTKHA